MKKIFLLFVFFVATNTFAQINGISYQAIILNPKGEQLPGVNNLNSPLVNKDICMVFKFVDEFSNVEYQETVQTKTDGFGMVNLVIGSGNQTAGYAPSFKDIVWNISKKSLIVGINTDGNCATYIEISNQNFSYVPLAFSAISAENVTGVVAIENGGTNATTLVDARTNLQINNVDNTSDVNKPISIATQSALNLKENLINKSTDVVVDGNSDVKYPSVKSVKMYVDGKLLVLSNAVNAEINRAITAENTIATNLTTETSARTSADNTLTTNLSTEVTNRTNADLLKEDLVNKSTNVTIDGTSDTKYPSVKSVKTYVDANAVSASTALANEVTRATNAENTIATNLTTETSVRTSADATLTTNLSTEVTNRTNADLLKEDLVNKSTNVTIDGTSDTKYPSVKSVKTYVDANAVSASTALANEVTRATNAENTIATNLTTETSVRTSADATLTTNLSTEVTNRTNADLLKEDLVNKSTNVTIDGTSDTKYPSVKSVKTYVDANAVSASTALANEVTRATNAENTIATNLTTETSVRTTADNTLTTNLASEVSRATTAENAIATVLATETTARTTADNTLTTNLASEVSRATTAENAIAADLATETTARTSADNTLTTNLASEVSRATTAENAIAADLATETTARTTADNTLTTNLASEVSRATTAENAIAADLATETTARTSADNTLTTNLASEVSRATTAENAIAADLATETTARTTADNTLTTNLASEVSRATTAENAIATDLATETTARTSADNTLTTNLASEVSRATTIENAIAADLATETTARTTADATLQTNINAVQSDVDVNEATVNIALALKAPLASPTFTGTPTLPTGTTAVTQTAGNNTTALATTEFVTSANATNANLTGPITSSGNTTSVALQTGTGSTFVMNTAPTLVTPVLGVATATSVNGTSIPTSKTLVVTTDKLNALSATTSAELAGVLSDETGTGSVVLSASPTFTGTPILPTGTTAVTQTAGNNTTALATTEFVTSANATNANLTGPITSSGNTTSVALQTGTGSTFVMNTAPTLVTPVLGVATATSVNGTSIPTSKTLVVTTDKLSALSATTSAELAGVLSDETGTGSVVLSASPTFTGTPILPTGTTAVTQTAGNNTTALATTAFVTAANSTNADLTGPITSSGNTTSVALQTGTGSTFVMNTAPTLVTPVLGVATATSVNGTSIPTSKTLVVTTDKLSALSATTSAELAGVLSDETGTGSVVLSASPTFTGTPILPTGTTAVTQTAGNNTTALATTAFVTAANSTNADLTGPITSSGNTTSVALQTGTGSTFVMNTAPTLVTPVLGVATATSVNGTSIPTSKTLVVTTDKLSALSATTSAELAGVLSDETGTGSVVLSASPTFTGTPILPTGTTAVTQTAGNNTTALATTAFVTAANSTNADLTGPITSSGNTTSVALQTGTGSTFVMNTAPTLVTPVLGVATATSVNGTSIPTSKTLVVTTDKLSALSATTSAELAGVISDETGTGSVVLSASPTFTGTPILPTGTTAVTQTAGNNTTALATTAFVTAANSTNADLTGPITSSGNTTSVASQTGTGSKFVMDTAPTLVTPVLGVATATSVNGTSIPTSKTLVVTTDKLSALSATTSTELAGVLSDETGTGSVVLSASPTFTGTPTLPTGTTAVTQTAGNNTTALATTAFVTAANSTNANLTGMVTSVGNATTVVTNANLTGPITSSGNATSVALQTGTGSKFVMDTAPTLVTPVLGVATATSVNGTLIPTSKTLVVTTDKLSALSATTSAELAGVLSDETGTGSVVLSASPTFTGTPTLPTGTTAVTQTAGNNTTALATTAFVTAANSTNANLTGMVTSVGNATTVVTNANLTGPITSSGNATSVALQTGTGSKFVMDTAPTLVTPVLGVATATSVNGTSIPTSKTLVVTMDKLSALSATTSAELAGVLSDETGTGSVVLSASPTFTGTPLAPTATVGTNTTQLATTAFVTTAISTNVREVADEFTATASQTSFTLAQTPSANSKVKMYINGIRISNTAYSTSGTTLTYVPANNGAYALTVGDRIQMDFYY